MESAVLSDGGLPLDLDEVPVVHMPVLDERDSVLANSIRRVIDAANRPTQDTVAAFQNYV